MHLHSIPSLRKLAKKMDMAGPTVTNAINHQAGIGLDYLVALHRRFHRSADELLDDDPPTRLPDGRVVPPLPSPK